MTAPTSNEVLELLSRTLAAHNVDGSLAKATGEEFFAMLEGRPIERLDVLDGVVVDFAAAAHRLVLPERAAHLDEQASILDHWGGALDALDALRALSAGIGLHCDELASESDESQTPSTDQALSQLFWGAHVVACKSGCLLLQSKRLALAVAACGFAGIGLVTVEQVGDSKDALRLIETAYLSYPRQRLHRRGRQRNQDVVALVVGRGS